MSKKFVVVTVGEETGEEVTFTGMDNGSGTSLQNALYKFNKDRVDKGLQPLSDFPPYAVTEYYNSPSEYYTLLREVGVYPCNDAAVGSADKCLTPYEEAKSKLNELVDVLYDLGIPALDIPCIYDLKRLVEEVYPKDTIKIVIGSHLFDFLEQSARDRGYMDTDNPVTDCIDWNKLEERLNNHIEKVYIPGIEEEYIAVKESFYTEEW